MGQHVGASGMASFMVLYRAEMGVQPGGERPRDDERSPVAQLVEQAAVNRWVAGSSPARGAILGTGKVRPVLRKTTKALLRQGFFLVLVLARSIRFR